jgi:hypothetical protein
MIPSLQSNPKFTISHSFTPGRHIPAPTRSRAMPRRTSPVLSAQELRQIVLQIVG